MFEVNQEGRLILTDELGELLTRVQRKGNKDVNYETDGKLYGVNEKWAYPKVDGLTLKGDCEDISLYKLKLLVDEGVPLGALLMTIGVTEDGEGHCVLCVATVEKDFILCNMHETLTYPRTMRREGFKFLYRQRLGHAIDEPWDKLL